MSMVREMLEQSARKVRNNDNPYEGYAQRIEGVVRSWKGGRISLEDCCDQVESLENSVKALRAHIAEFKGA